MRLFCLDIGNTSAHAAIVTLQPRAEPAFEPLGDTPTKQLADPTAGLTPLLQQHGDNLDGLAFCSVVPAATAAFQTLLASLAWPHQTFHLRWDTVPNLPLLPYTPKEIGQDRLANAIAARALLSLPAVVIDMGTAVTFDIVTERGYEGGVIAPGLGVMTRYLHEQTALLPALDPNDLAAAEGIGRTTIDAMKLGVAVGFAGMIEALQRRTEAELETLFPGQKVSYVATGGSAGALPSDWVGTMRFEPDLTLLGLAFAYQEALT